MWNTPEISENNYINSSNIFNSDDIFISGVNLFQNEENILLSIKFNNKIVFVDGEDHPIIDLNLATKGLYFKRELTEKKKKCFTN